MKRGANGMEHIDPHVKQAAAYGGHDAHGGHQKPRGPKPSKGLVNPSPTGTMLRENVMPPTGPASGNVPLTGPMGSGGSSGAGN
jgi:hypothetical protein